MTGRGYASTPPCSRYCEAQKAGLKAVPDGVVWGGRRIQAALLANQPVEDEGEHYEGDESGEENPGQIGRAHV